MQSLMRCLGGVWFVFSNNHFQFLNTHTKRALSLQKSASDRIGLGYGFSSSNIASTSTTVFIPPGNNVEIENNTVKIGRAHV